jgi:5-formyltetrahydrofolate cyclo-ligase
VDPSPPTSSGLADPREIKAQLRKRYRALRREHVAALPLSTRGLLFMRPPKPVLSIIPDGATIGLYHAHEAEAPTLAYARWFHENGYPITLPCFSDRGSSMTFRIWADPYDAESLELGPFGMPQPAAEAAEATPQVLFMPLVAFTAEGARLGQGGGHYDRWLEAHPETVAIGLAWDAQLADSLPLEPHDRPLAMVVTPTRLYEGNR